MTILGIETSCDETALALIETRRVDGVFECRIISSLIHSQADLHSPYGGVFPTLAKREHEKNLPILFEKITKDKPSIDAIAVTEGPGLEPALWTGITFAKKISKDLNVPVIPVNHMEGHIVGSLLLSDTPDGSWQQLKQVHAPGLALLISGGHTELVRINALGSYSIIGQTKDDAVGEAFDKVARLLGLPYPGGPHISRLAQQARTENITSNIKLPRPMITSADLNFSFSGLKTAVLYAIRDTEKSGAIIDDTFKKGLCREFEDAVNETICTKVRSAVEAIGAQTLIVGGGVSANSFLRLNLEKIATEFGIPLYLPTSHISGDNALMIALAGALDSSSTTRPLKAQGTKRLGPVPDKK